MARTISIFLLAATVMACGRYSYRIRSAYSRGNYQMALNRCQNDGMAANTRWNDAHEARYHVYCGMTYLSLGDSSRAASELVLAERLRQANPRLITGRDLERLNAGLVQLFGAPAGQLLIEERGVVAAAIQPAPQASTQILVPPAPEPPEAVPEPPAPPAPPAITLSATVTAEQEDEPTPPAAPAAPSTPVIVIPEEEAAVIE